MQIPMNVMVTGGDGMLGTAFSEMSSDFPMFDVRSLGHKALDVTNAEAVNGFADWLGSGWIVHCAAIVSVEGCVSDPNHARNVIVDGTKNIVELARRTRSRILYPQSFLTYDGFCNPIPENETPRPLSLYGHLKYEAEQLITAETENPLILRMAGFFGGEARDKNFVGKIIPVMHSAIQRGETKFEVGTRIWQPTWTKDLALNSLHLMARNAHGSYQMSCRDQASFAEVAEEIVQAMGWQEVLTITAVDPASVASEELGKRPDAAILSGTRLLEEQMNLQRQWRPTLYQYLQHPYFDRYRLETSR